MFLPFNKSIPDKFNQINKMFRIAFMDWTGLSNSMSTHKKMFKMHCQAKPTHFINKMRFYAVERRSRWWLQCIMSFQLLMFSHFFFIVKHYRSVYHIIPVCTHWCLCAILWCSVVWCIILLFGLCGLLRTTPHR